MTRTLVVTALMVTLATAAVTPGHSQGTVLQGCYVPGSGTIYRVGITGAPASCVAASHVAFTWNVEGPAGPTGPQGAAGAQGPPGPSGFTGFQVIFSLDASVPNNVDYPKLLTCPAGKVPLGGGLEGPARYVKQSHPYVNSPESWYLLINHDFGGPIPLHYYLYCVTP